RNSAGPRPALSRRRCCGRPGTSPWDRRRTGIASRCHPSRMSPITALPPVQTAKVAIAVNIAKKAGAVDKPQSANWRAYPFQLVSEDPQLCFPAAEGNHPDCESDTWFIAGELTANSGHRFAFLTIFNKNRPA